MIKSRIHTAALLLAALFGIGTIMVGCGQKGPLYHPDKEQQEQQQQKKSGS